MLVPEVNVFCGFFFDFMHFIIPFRKFRPPYPGKTTAVTQVVLPSLYLSACWVFLCFRNPPKSGMDYRFFNVRDHSFACVYTQELGTLTTSQHNSFNLEKLTNFSCTLDRVRTSGLWISIQAYMYLCEENKGNRGEGGWGGGGCGLQDVNCSYTKLPLFLDEKNISEFLWRNQTKHRTSPVNIIDLRTAPNADGEIGSPCPVVWSQ